MEKEEIKGLISQLEKMALKKDKSAFNSSWISRTLRDLKGILYKIELQEQYGIVIKDGQNAESSNFYGQCDIYDVCYITKWSERCKVFNSKEQPKVNRLIYSLRFNTGAYIFGNDYDTELFDEFFEKLKTYKPDFVDPLNHCLYWYIENAKPINNKINSLYKVYLKKHFNRQKEGEIQRLEKELKRLKEGEEE